ncbi:MAG: cupin domain-containing protein [Gemmatimonadetes bacterium]|nr:cupin domain-containing protein [Gemmatimonadota bacterium]
MMTQTAAPRATPTIVPAGGGKRVDAFGSEIRFALTAEHTGGALTLGFATVPPGEGPPPHLHHDEDELFIIVDGSYAVLAEGEWTGVGPGAVVYIPRGSVHTFRNAGESLSRHWVLTTPSGFEQFYEKCEAVFAEPGPPDMPQILAIAAAHGIRFA